MTLTLEEPVATFTLPDVTEEEVKTTLPDVNLPTFTLPDVTEWEVKTLGIRIDPDHKREWCDALRSGRFQQIRSLLTDGKTGRCAMGVLSSIAEMEVRKYLLTLALPSSLRRTLRDPIAAWLGVSDGEYAAISSLVIHWNDIGELSFAEIADRIERKF